MPDFLLQFFVMLFRGADYSINNFCGVNLLQPAHRLRLLISLLCTLLPTLVHADSLTVNTITQSQLQQNEASTINELCLIVKCEATSEFKGLTKRNTAPLLQKTRVNKLLMIESSVVSEQDGSAEISIRLERSGTSACQATLVIWHTKKPYGQVASVDYIVHFEEGDGPLKIAKLTVPVPGLYTVKHVNIIGQAGRCSGKSIETQVQILPHEDFPCSLYPGYKKEVLGKVWLCAKGPPPADIGASKYKSLCLSDTIFLNAAGYYFGCF